MRSARSRLLLLVGACLASLVLWALLLLAAGAILGGGVPELEKETAAMDAWMARMSSWFLAWRVLLYAGTVAGWIWMRRRIRQREPDRETNLRLLRMEIAAVAAFFALEANLLLRAG